MRDFLTKQSLYDQSRVLQAQIEANEPFYDSEMLKFQQRIQTLIDDRKVKIKDMQNKFSDITPLTEDIEKRLTILETPRMRELSVAKSFEPFKLPMLAA